MSELSIPQPPAPTVFVLPEHAHLILVTMRSHLRLLSKLTEPGTSASAYDALFRPDALSWWFSNLSREIDGVIDATYWCPMAAEAAKVHGLADRDSVPGDEA
jgi:hypothetical protein